VILSPLLALALGSQIQGIEVPSDWYKELPPALAQARKQHKDLLIDFSGSDWCLPCRWLKQRVFSKPEFVGLAKSQFVLVDIDDLERGGNSAATTARYKALQKSFGVTSFPSVVLATPGGDAYAWTTWSKGAGDSPEAFWKSVQSMHQRGLAFRVNVDKSQGLTGAARAQALVTGLSQLRADILLRFEGRYVEQLRAADPNDKSGFLNYLGGRGALTKLEERMPEQGQAPTVSLPELNGVIDRYHLSGETLQDALSFKALLQVYGKDPSGALQSFRDLVAAQGSRGPYDHGEFMPIGPSDLATMSAEIDRGSTDPNDRINEYHSLNLLFEHDLPSRFVVSCGPYFSPTIDSRLPIGTEFGRLLLERAGPLSGEAKAKALSDPLAGTSFYNEGTIRQVVDTVKNLVGAREAHAVLPKPYCDWVPAGNGS